MESWKQRRMWPTNVEENRAIEPLDPVTNFPGRCVMHRISWHHSAQFTYQMRRKSSLGEMSKNIRALRTLRCPLDHSEGPPQS